MKFIIEHLEPKLYEWCLIEYKHISKLVGKKNLIFTNIKNQKDISKLRKLGSVKKESVAELKLNKACLLDPKASKTLNHNQIRNLGKRQMSTDTAVLVTKTIAKGKPLNKINFIDEPSITIKKGKFNEEIILPYRYVARNNRPL